jgi:arginase
VIWIDAHADFNTVLSSPSGNIHGMPLAALCGLGDPRLVNLDLATSKPATGVLNPDNVVILGARDIDPGEKQLLKQHGVLVFTMHDIDRQGMTTIMNSALARASAGTEGIYLSLDLDVLDPLYAPGVGTPVSGGLNYREAHLACELIAESGLLLGMDLVEVNPILDTYNQTANMAVELALSAFGKRIY